MLSFKIGDPSRTDGIARLQLFYDHVLLRVMAEIRIIIEVVDDSDNDPIIRVIAMIEHIQLPLQHAKQFFEVGMFLT
jgi:hypothetical protein